MDIEVCNAFKRGRAVSETLRKEQRSQASNSSQGPGGTPMESTLTRWRSTRSATTHRRNNNSLIEASELGPGCKPSRAVSLAPQNAQWPSVDKPARIHSKRFARSHEAAVSRRSSHGRLRACTFATALASHASCSELSPVVAMRRSSARDARQRRRAARPMSSHASKGVASQLASAITRREQF